MSVVKIIKFSMPFFQFLRKYKNVSRKQSAQIIDYSF